MVFSFAQKRERRIIIMSMDDLRNLLSDDEYAGLEEYLSESESEN
jgi:hypothetical protein